VTAALAQQPQCRTARLRVGAPRGHPGLYHTAFLYPDPAAFGWAVQRVLDAAGQLDMVIAPLDIAALLAEAAQ